MSNEKRVKVIKRRNAMSNKERIQIIKNLVNKETEKITIKFDTIADVGIYAVINRATKFIAYYGTDGAERVPSNSSLLDHVMAEELDDLLLDTWNNLPADEPKQGETITVTGDETIDELFAK